MNCLEQELRRLSLVNEPNIASIVRSFVPSICIDLYVKSTSGIRQYRFDFEHFMNCLYPKAPTSVLQNYMQMIPYQYKAEIYYFNPITQERVVVFTTYNLESLDQIQRSIHLSILHQRIVL